MKLKQLNFEINFKWLFKFALIMLLATLGKESTAQYAPSAPPLTSPADSSSVQPGKTIHFTWNAPSRGTAPITYTFYYYNGSAWQSWSTGSNLYYDLLIGEWGNSSSCGSNKRWYVKATNAYGFCNSVTRDLFLYPKYSSSSADYSITPTSNCQSTGARSIVNGGADYYSFSATAGNTYYFSTCGSDIGCGSTGSFDTYLKIYGTNKSCTTSAYNDNGGVCILGKSYINSWTCSATGTYYLQITGAANNAYGNYYIQYKLACPTLTASLSGGSNNICYNTSPSTFTATGNGGNSSYTYLWYKNGTTTGITTNTYNTGALTASATVYCAVSSCGQTANTSTYTVTVYPTLGTPTLSGGSTNICYNTSPSTFTAIGSGGNSSYTYLWYKNGTSTGITTNTYNTGLLTASATVYCAVSSCGQTANTSTYTVTVYPTLGTPTLSGGSTNICYNTSPSTFSATGTGGNSSYTYLWYKNGTSTGIITNTYNTGALTASATVYCAVSSCGQTANTSTYTVTVHPTLGTPILSGGSTNICYNTAPTTFTATGSGGNSSYTYLWYKNGTSTGITTNTYNTGALTANATLYCRVSSCGQSANTSAYTVAVYPTLGTPTLSGGSTNICYNTSPSTFTATGSGGNSSYTYLWYKNGTSTGITTNIYNTGALIASATVYCAVSSCGQTANTSTYSIIVNPLPFVEAGIDTAITAGDSTQIGSNPIAGSNYLWSPGLGISDSTIAKPWAKPTSSMYYFCKVTNINSGCSNSDSVKISVSTSCSTAIGLVNHDIYNPQIFNLSDTILWFKFEPDSIRTRIEIVDTFNISNKIIEKMTLYIGYCNNLSKIAETALNYIHLDSTKIDSTYYLKISRRANVGADKFGIALLKLGTKATCAYDPCSLITNGDFQTSPVEGNSFSPPSVVPCWTSFWGRPQLYHNISYYDAICYTSVNSNVFGNDAIVTDAGVLSLIANKYYLLSYNVTSGSCMFNYPNVYPFKEDINVCLTDENTFSNYQTNYTTTIPNIPTNLFQKIDYRPGLTTNCITWNNTETRVACFQAQNNWTRMYLYPENPQLVGYPDTDPTNEAIFDNIKLIPLEINDINRYLCDNGVILGFNCDLPSNITYLWSPATGLSATNIAHPIATPTSTTVYTVTISYTDPQNNNTYTHSFNQTVYVSNQPTSANASSNSPVCEGQTLNLTSLPDGATSYSWSGPNSFTSQTQNPSITGATLAAEGNYTVTVNANGCSSTDDVTVDIINGFGLSPNSVDETCYGSLNGSASINITNGTAPFSYYWENSNGVNYGNSTSNPLTDLISDTYYVTVTDANGCSSNTSVSVGATNTAGWPYHPSNGTDKQRGTGVAVDDDGNVYAVGYFQGNISFGNTNYTTNGGQDIYIVKFDQCGDIVWTKSIGGIGAEMANNIIIDGAGNIIITGYFQQTVNFGGTSKTSAGNSDLFVAKYYNSGSLWWVYQYGTQLPTDIIDVGNDVTVDASDNVYIVGTVGSGNTGNVYLLKLDENGNYINQRFENSTVLAAKGLGITYCDACGTNSKILVTGKWDNGVIFISSWDDGLINNPIRYDYAYGEGRRIVSDANYAYVAGFKENSGLRQIEIIKANLSNLNNNPQEITSGSTTGYDAANDIKIDQNGDLFITGQFTSAVAEFPISGGISKTNSSPCSPYCTSDNFVAKYSQTNNAFDWVVQSGSTDEETSLGLSLIGNGFGYVTGAFQNIAIFGATTLTAAADMEMFVARVHDMGADGEYRRPEAIGNSDDNIIEKINAGDNIIIYPNPTKEILNIECKTTNYVLHITDLLGTEMLRIPVSGNKTQIDISNFNSGVYLVKIEFSDEVFIKKFAVIK